MIRYVLGGMIRTLAFLAVISISGLAAGAGYFLIMGTGWADWLKIVALIVFVPALILTICLPVYWFLEEVL